VWGAQVERAQLILAVVAVAVQQVQRVSLAVRAVLGLQF